MILKLLITIGILNFLPAQGNIVLGKGESCAKLLNEYKSSMQEFLICTMGHAVPVSLCFNCSHYYTDLTERFDILIKAQVDEGSHTVKCHDKYIDQDRLNIILRNHDYCVSLWNEAACPECFGSYDNETQEMFDRLTSLKDCLTHNWDKNPCVTCLIDYNEANSFYNERIVKNHKDHICFDLRDDMNRTRSMWSKSLKCCKREVDIGPFAAFASCIACLPIVFYVLSYFCTRYFENRSSFIEGSENPPSDASYISAIDNGENNARENLPSSSTGDYGATDGGATGGVSSKSISKHDEKHEDQINWPKEILKDEEKESKSKKLKFPSSSNKTHKEREAKIIDFDDDDDEKPIL